MEDHKSPFTGCQRSETVHVILRSPTETREVTARGDCTVRQLRAGLAERMGVQAEGLVHCGRVLGDTELLSSLQGKDRAAAVELCLLQRPGCTCSVSTEEDRESVLSPRPATLDTEAEAQTPSSPLFLVEGLDSLGLSDSGPGLFPTLQSQMERQLLADPEVMRRVLGSPLVQSTLSSAGPELTRTLILSSPQVQQLLQSDPELGEVLCDSEVITQVLELVRNPDMIKEVLKNEDTELGNSRAKQDSHHFTFSQKTANTKQEKEVKPSQHHCTDPLRNLTATSKADISPQSTISTGMQLLLEQITSSPGLMENLLSGPYVSNLLQCLSHNPELAAQMLLSHPLLSENPPLQQQMRQQLPLLLQQMQSPELLSAMLNPKAVEALLQIQQGLHILAKEAPALIPAAGFGNPLTSELGSDSVLNNKPRGGPAVSTATEQQQQFVQQMLQVLANTEHKDLDRLSSEVFEDR